MCNGAVDVTRTISVMYCKINRCALSYPRVSHYCVWFGLNSCAKMDQWTGSKCTSLLLLFVFWTDFIISSWLHCLILCASLDWLHQTFIKKKSKVYSHGSVE